MTVYSDRTLCLEATSHAGHLHANRALVQRVVQSIRCLNTRHMVHFAAQYLFIDPSHAVLGADVFRPIIIGNLRQAYIDDSTLR